MRDSKFCCRKSASKAKLKAASLEERLLKWKEHFSYLLENLPEITDKSSPKIIDNQQEIKQGQLMQEELETVQTNIKRRKTVGFERQKNLTKYFFDYATLYLNKTQLRNGRKAASSSLKKKRYRNRYKRIRIWSEIEKILKKKKNQNGFLE